MSKEEQDDRLPAARQRPAGENDAAAHDPEIRSAIPLPDSEAADAGRDRDSDGEEGSYAATGARAELHESPDEQAEFREQFDEDLYTDREDRPAQGNTADVAMEHRFGSEADAYAEYAWRRPGGHHQADGTAVGQSRDPADTGEPGS